MKCPKCEGTGEMQICEMGFIGKDECDKCHGKGYLTNDEWRKTCSAEEFAEWITDKINAKVGMALHDAELYDGDVNENEYMENEDEWVEWLKQPHIEKGVTNAQTIQTKK